MILGVHILVGSETLQNGLVGHWKFDETNGTTAHDSSGNEYNAILLEQVMEVVRGWMESSEQLIWMDPMIT